MLKANLKTFGANSAAEFAFNLEKMGKSRKLVDAEQNLRKLEESLQQVITEGKKVLF